MTDQSFSQRIRGGAPGEGGWISRSFGRKQPCATLEWECDITGPTTLRTRIDFVRHE